MTADHSLLYYVHDPMCSWCWGFRETWQLVQQQLPDNVKVRYVLGGLAPDSNDPMPGDMQIGIRDTWRTIQKQIAGTVFNFNFWDVCQPRRSTYPSCRAVIAASKQDSSKDKAMVLAIQEAYYLQAKNPSDNEVLIELAEQLGLDVKKFADDLSSDEAQVALISEIEFSRELGVRGFPSLVFETNGKRKLLQIDYNNVDVILSQVV